MTAIVVAPDGSNSGRRALEHAKRRAGTIGDRVLVAFVIDRPPCSAHSAEELKRREEIDQARRFVLGGLAKEAEDEGFPAATAVRHGDAALQLDAVAEDRRADRIVTGGTGALGPRDRPFGERAATAAVPATIIR